WTRSLVIQAISDRSHYPEHLAYSRVPIPLRAAGERFFGSWRAAIEASGFDYNQVRLLRTAYSTREGLDEIAAVGGRYPERTVDELVRHKVYAAVYPRFPSLSAALYKAGIRGWPREIHERWSRRRVIQELRGIVRAGQRIPRRLSDACRRHFGSVRAALAIA